MADDFVDQAFEAQYKLALQLKEDFVYEGHFTEESSWTLIRMFKKENYRINMLFMGLASLKISLDRVFKRAMNGGHNVPSYEIERNYFGNLYKLNEHFELIDELIILDSSKEIASQLVICKDGQAIFNIAPPEMPVWFRHHLPNIYKKSLTS